MSTLVTIEYAGRVRGWRGDKRGGVEEGEGWKTLSG